MPAAPRLPSGSGVGGAYSIDGISRVATPESEYRRMEEGGDSNGNGAAATAAPSGSSSRSPRASQNGANGTTVLGGANEGPATLRRGDPTATTTSPYRTCHGRVVGSGRPMPSLIASASVCDTRPRASLHDPGPVNAYPAQAYVQSHGGQRPPIVPGTPLVPIAPMPLASPAMTTGTDGVGASDRSTAGTYGACVRSLGLGDMHGSHSSDAHTLDNPSIPPRS